MKDPFSRKECIESKNHSGSFPVSRSDESETIIRIRTVHQNREDEKSPLGFFEGRGREDNRRSADASLLHLEVLMDFFDFRRKSSKFRGLSDPRNEKTRWVFE
jgi:hypothetical protein